jgi:hypothetical protein
MLFKAEKIAKDHRKNSIQKLALLKEKLSVGFGHKEF